MSGLRNIFYYNSYSETLASNSGVEQICQIETSEKPDTEVYRKYMEEQKADPAIDRIEARVSNYIEAMKTLGERDIIKSVGYNNLGYEQVVFFEKEYHSMADD